MASFRAVAAGVLFALAVPSQSAAQARPRDNLLTVDAEIVGATVGYARAHDPGRYLGVELGIGGSFLSRTLLAGRHFSEAGGPSYESRDGADDKLLFEILHAAAFHRWAGGGSWSWDLGVRGSMFFHFDSSDDDPGAAGFGGAYAAAMWGGRRFRIGPRLLVGVFTEGSGTTELGVYLVPAVGRITFGW